jgi:CRP/FNR family transcriptional regulator, cyclic AMP receptor protein
MLERFQGVDGKRLLIEALRSHKLLAGNIELIGEIAEQAALEQIAVGQLIIEQNESANDIFFVVSGAFDVIVNGRIVGKRGAGDHIGEMAAIEPTQRRSASVMATHESIVARLTEAQFSALGSHYVELYRGIARELSRRLLQRNALVNAKRDQIKLFIISSVEALPVARELQNAFEHDPFTTTVWTDGVFKVAHYTLESLEDQVDQSDFAVAIAHADDLTEFRGQDWPTPRDNVIFELGLFMGRLGRSRAILMEPRGDKLKLPSDLAGITTIPYRFEKGDDSAALMAPAANKLRAHIIARGPNN